MMINLNFIEVANIIELGLKSDHAAYFLINATGHFVIIEKQIKALHKADDLIEFSPRECIGVEIQFHEILKPYTANAMQLESSLIEPDW